jgi:hypothetical protein
MGDTAVNLAGMTFPQWLKAVDRVLAARHGVRYRDLADFEWYDAWESDIPASEAAAEALANEFGDYFF